MLSRHTFTRTALAFAALALALPAAAGTLAPQLQALQASYTKAPKSTVARAMNQTAAPSRHLFAPHVNATGKVQIYMHFKNGAAPAKKALARLGASDVLVSRPLGVVQAWVPIAKLDASAALGGVSEVTLPVYGYAKGAGPQPAAGSCSAVPTGLDIDNEGIAAQNIGPVHAQDIKGAGVKVGIISNGVDCIASSQAAGYVPNSVHVIAAGSGSEGVAMLEEVHAVAPKATLGFCGPATSVDFLTCLDSFAQWGADVISDDLGFFPAGYNFSVFTDADTGDNSIVEFAAQHPDITLTTAGGNSADSYFEADYKIATNPTTTGTKGSLAVSLSPDYTVGNHYLAQYMAPDRDFRSAMDIGGALGKGSDAAVTVTVYPGASVYGNLTWNDPTSPPYDDLDLFLFKAVDKTDGSGQKLVLACDPTQDHWCSSTVDQMSYASQGVLPPLEFLSYKNTTNSPQTLYLVAYCFDCNAHGTKPLHVKLYGFGNGGAVFNYNTPGGIAGHTTLDAEITTAAARVFQGLVGMEPFSDRGPFTYGDWTQSSKTKQKPDITGIDGVTVSGAGGFSNPFFGTSAASPNVGAIVALLRGYAPSAAANADEWKQIIMDAASKDAITGGFQTTGGIPFEAYSPAASGAGLVDAAAAVSSVAPAKVTATITAPSVTSGQAVKADPATDVSFVATCDYPGSTAPTYKWTFGGNSGIADSSKLTPDPVQYANGGIYTVTFSCSADKQTASDSVTMAVQAAATAEDASFEVKHDQKVTGKLSGTGIGGEQVSFASVEDPAHGAFQLAADGSFSYTPNKGFNGQDAFTFAITNGVMKSNAATVTLTVAAGKPPTASDGALTVTENKAGSGILQATDPDGDPLTFSIVSQPSHGTVAIDNDATGAYTYTPTQGYSGSDSFSFKANDGNADSNTAKVSITVKKAPSGGGGGGAFGGLALGLLGALLLALRRKH